MWKVGSIVLNIIIAAAFPLFVMADVPAPSPQKAASEAQSFDWTFVLLGAISAFLGAILFLWLGRKLFKRS